MFDRSNLYRYTLWRCWNQEKPAVAFIMLSPSKADEQANDPTITRCINFAKALGFGSLEVVNLFAYKATKPRTLYGVRDPVGPDNDRYILDAVLRAHSTVLAWGNHGRLKDRSAEVRLMLCELILSNPE